MKPSFISTIVMISFLLLCVIKSHELRQMNRFFRAERTIKIKTFAHAKKDLSLKDQELLELWESMLTGRSAPLARWMKDQYKSLGLNHLFTPSGFHLSAVLLPFMKFFKSTKWQLSLLIVLGVFIFSLPGQGALKRMVLVKSHQKVLGQHWGFFIALLLDVLFGSFSNSPLSFCYSFLFLGIIYAGVRNLFLYFFMAQCLIAYFNGELISPLILLLSPALNLAFGVAMPLLFVLAFPLWNWQLHAGLTILRFLQFLVGVSAQIISLFPCLEITIGILVIFILFYLGERKWLALALLVLTSNLNLDQARQPSLGMNDFVPQGAVKKVIKKEKEDLVYFSDGKCQRELVRGLWWEKCSPRRRSRGHRFMKLSSL